MCNQLKGDKETNNHDGVYLTTFCDLDPPWDYQQYFAPEDMVNLFLKGHGYFLKDLHWENTRNQQISPITDNMKRVMIELARCGLLALTFTNWELLNQFSLDQY